MRLLWFPLAVLTVTWVQGFPRAREESYRGGVVSIDDGGVNPLALSEFGYGAGGEPHRPVAARHREYARPKTARHEYGGPVGTKHREYAGHVASKHREYAGPVVKKHREYGGPVATKSGSKHKAKTSAPRPRVRARPRARPARLRPHPKGKITINGKEEPIIKTHGKVHSCKKTGFQWEKCNTISHNLKCEICFPRVQMKFELCQESHRGNSKRCLEALYWMFKQKVSAVKRRFPHWQDRQKLDKSSNQSAGQIAHRRYNTPYRGRGRRPGHRKYPEFFRGDNIYTDDQNSKQVAGGMRKRV